MDDNKAKIRINFSNREIEFEGTEKFIKEYLDKYKDLIESFKVIPPSKPIKEKKAKPGKEPVSIDKELPQELEEYLQKFPSDISDQDKFLIAAYFIQNTDKNNSYKVSATTKILKDIGINVKATGTVNIRHKKQKRCFYVKALGKGFYRISKEGTDYITKLKKPSI